MLICYSKNYTNNINVCSYVNFLKPIERGRNELCVWFPALSACVCRNTHRIRNSYKPDSNRHNGIDLLQDIFQGRLLLGARFVNARTNSEYNHALCSGLQRLADSKRTAITETATGKAESIKYESYLWLVKSYLAHKPPTTTYVFNVFSENIL